MMAVGFNLNFSFILFLDMFMQIRKFMKINRVTVKGLFGVFDHDIPFKKESGVTIIIGENGLGKTVILESINAFFGGNLKFFTVLNFERFTFHFDTNEC